MHEHDENNMPKHKRGNQGGMQPHHNGLDALTRHGLSPDKLLALSKQATQHNSPQDVFATLQMQLIQRDFFTPSTVPEDLPANPHNQNKKDSLKKDLNEGVEAIGTIFNTMENLMGTMLNTGVNMSEQLIGAAEKFDAVAGSSNNPAISGSATKDSLRTLPSTHPRQNRRAIGMGVEDETVEYDYDSDSSCSSASSENRPANRKGFTSGTHEYDGGSSNQPTTVFVKRVTEESSRISPTHPQVAQGIEGLGKGLISTVGNVGGKLLQAAGELVTDSLNNPVTKIMKQKESCKKKVMIGSAVGIASALILILNVTQPFKFIENLPSKANLAITIASGLIIALAIAFVAYYKSKENDCDTQLSHIKGVQSCSRSGRSA